MRHFLPFEAGFSALGSGQSAIGNETALSRQLTQIFALLVDHRILSDINSRRRSR